MSFPGEEVCILFLVTKKNKGVKEKLDMALIQG